MGKKKYYAVKYGIKPGIYESWGECEAQTKGYSGAQFKSFGTMVEAEKYMTSNSDINIVNQDTVFDSEQINNRIEDDLNKLGDNEVIAFVDGSYNSSEQKSGFGVIIIDNKGIQIPLYKAFTKQYNSEFLELRNVAAELEGVKEAIKWAIAYSKKTITIYYDYEGIEKWADGSWKANKEITRQYVSFIKDKMNLIEIKFNKVPAHSGIMYNEAADRLARNSLLEKGYKTYNDGSIYFVGLSGNDWKDFINQINEEKQEFTDKEDSFIKMEINSFNERQRMVVTDSSNKVVINCYSNCNSYVQGKQSVLFQKIVCLAIE